MQTAHALLDELGISKGMVRKGRLLGLADLMKWAARMEVGSVHGSLAHSTLVHMLCAGFLAPFGRLHEAVPLLCVC